MRNPLPRIALCLAVALAVGCSKREKPAAEDAEWSDIQPLADKPAVVAPVPQQPVAPTNAVALSGPQADFSPLVRRLEEMQTVGRAKDETLLTGESLVFDYMRRAVRMEGAVRVVDDRGEMEAATLAGRFNVSNQVESIDAGGGVVIHSEGRVAQAERATYGYRDGAVLLEGKAEVSEDGNRLSGEQIRFWTKGSRRMVCEPNAMLEIASAKGIRMQGVPEGGATSAEIRSDRVVYDESGATVEFDGDVRVRDPRIAVDCGMARLHLKENNQIDWIEATSDVIIQSERRKALCERANYYADDGRFVLEGDPKVGEGRNIMTGDRITFWIEPRRMVCEPNARVLFYPDEETKRKFMKDLRREHGR